jgi:hypothetical protein
MKHNGRMGLIDRIFGSGGSNGAKARDTAVQASTQFYESEPDAEDSQVQRNAPRRELVQVVLRDTMRKHGIPSDWVECRILSTISRSGRRGLHVNFVVRQAHGQLLPYVFAFQDSFERELTRYDPRSRDWLLSRGWEFMDARAEQMGDAKSWTLAGAAAAAAAATAPADAQSQAQPDEAASRKDDDVQKDLQALFAIRDAALADAARKPRDDLGHRDFEPTQPFDDSDKPQP